MRDYKNIKAYRYADDLVVEVYQVTKKFPKEEIYGLTSQIRRAAISISSNIAEGASRQHHRDYLHFLYMARGSMSETEYLVHLARRLGYLNSSEFERINELCEEAAKTLYGLIQSVSKEVGPSSKSHVFVTIIPVFSLSLWSIVYRLWSSSG